MTFWLVSRLWRGAGPVQWALTAVLVATAALAAVVLLAMASVPAAFQSQEDRLAWTQFPRDWTAQADPETTADYVYVHPVVDYVAGQRVTVVNVATHGEGVAPPAGIPRFPAPGETLISPALQDALAQHPEVSERYGEVVGEISADSLRGPNHLMAVRGATEQQLDPVAVPITELSHEAAPASSTTLTLLLSLAGVALLVPPLLLAYTATSALTQAHRRRMANLVIAGAPAAVIRRIVAGETLMASILGILLGGAAFLGLRPALAGLLVGEPAPFSSDLTPAWLLVLLIAAGLPLIVTGIGLRTARSAVRQPLISTVTAREQIPTGWPAAVGFLLLASALTLGWAGIFSGTRQTLLLMALGGTGLVLVLPWLGRRTGRWMLSSRRPALVLSGGWLEAAPWSTARGVVAASLAVFVATVFVMLNPTAVAALPYPVIQQPPGTVTIEARALSTDQVSALVDDLRQITGVQAAASVIEGTVQTGQHPLTAWIGDCRQIATAAELAEINCDDSSAAWTTPAAEAALQDPSLQVTGLAPATLRSLTAAPDPDETESLPVPDASPELRTATAATDRPHLIIDSARAGLDVSDFRPTLVLVRTTDPAALTQVRTAALTTDPTSQVATRATSQEGYDGQLREYYSLMLWGATGTFLTAAAALFASALTGIVRRSTSTAVVQAMGTPTRTLRTAVLLSVSAPMALGTVLALLIGISCASSLLYSLGSPSGAGLIGLWPLVPAIILATAAGATAALAIPKSARLNELPGE
ncbi:hypothetical protein [Ornithinimicrobium flavum]|uniref:hypothetical protein n=1 Tax=Ornithinimicrobium flavum TaxID=1288636 RepID=UPI0010704405|nr:hypothetical protein [Ornithinimicrobium flavum]